MNEQVFLGECPIIRPEGIYYGGRRVIRLGLNDTPLAPGKYKITVTAAQAPLVEGWLALNSISALSRVQSGSADAITYTFNVTASTTWPSTLPQPQTITSPAMIAVYATGMGLLVLGAHELLRR